MTTRPANLILLRPFAGDAGQRLLPGGRRAPAPIASRAGVLDRLATFGDLAPDAPLSFLLVLLPGCDPDDRVTLARAGACLRELTRPTDVLGVFGPAAFAFVLQGTGATAAEAVAARVRHQLDLLGESLGIDLKTAVYAATGTGLNALTLPAAATPPLAECC